MAVIELDNLEVHLGGRPILKGLTQALTGRSIGLLGPNGAGKSTLIHSLLGFYPPLRGTARLFGRDIRTDGRALRGLIGYMPESDAFLANVTGVRFVRMMCELSGLPPEAAKERAHEAFFYVGLGEARYRPVGSYSLGMKQLVKLAQAIAHGPKLIFLDEPTNGLDPPARERMIKLVREIRDTMNMHVVISSHLLRDVEECCEEVLILKAGRIAAYCNLEAERRANRNFLELETVGGGPDFREALERVGRDCAWLAPPGAASRQAGRVKLVLADGVPVQEIYRVAAERNVQIRRLSHRRDSLEDLFLKAMEDKEVPDGRIPAAVPAL